MASDRDSNTRARLGDAEGPVVDPQPVEGQPVEASALLRADQRHVSLAVAFGVPLLFIIDVAAGDEITVPFYVPLVGYASLRLGWQVGLALSIVAATLGALSDHLSSPPMWALATSWDDPMAPWWNAAGRLAVCALVAIALSSVRASMARQRRLVSELRTALAQVRSLQGLLPICAWCKCVRDEAHDGDWVPLEQYIAAHTRADFTHGICPACAERMGTRQRSSR